MILKLAYDLMGDCNPCEWDCCGGCCRNDEHKSRCKTAHNMDCYKWSNSPKKWLGYKLYWWYNTINDWYYEYIYQDD